jgi:dTDP-4-dehydrorhamnose 3,5-epimerase
MPQNVKFNPGPIEGVVVKELPVHRDARGRLMEILRADDPLFASFGQVYMTVARPGVVKAWHCHERQTDHFCVVAGTARIALYDGRNGSPSRGAVMEVIAGEDNAALVVIPPGVYHGFRAVGAAEVRILNIPTELYDPKNPDEIRRPYNDPTIPYDWGPADAASG